MDRFYSTYKQFNKSEIHEVIGDCDELTLNAKYSLLKAINERPSEIDKEQIEKVQSSIQNELEDIKGLWYVEKLGIEMKEENGELKIAKSKKSNIRDTTGFIIGFVFSLALFAALVLWYFTVKKGIEPLNLIMAIVFTAIGVVGLQLLFKTIDRIYFFNIFSVVKGHDGIEINHKSRSGNEKKVRMDFNAQLMLEENEKGDSLVIQDGSQIIVLLKYNELGRISKVSLKYMAERFNNWEPA